MTETVKDRIAKTVSENDVVLYMKGNPTFPQCGFSSTVVQILDYLGTEYHSVNVLEDDEIRQGVKVRFTEKGKEKISQNLNPKTPKKIKSRELYNDNEDIGFC